MSSPFLIPLLAFAVISKILDPTESMAVAQEFDDNTTTAIFRALKYGGLARNSVQAVISGRISSCESNLLTPADDIPAVDTLEYSLKCTGYTGEVVLTTSYHLSSTLQEVELAGITRDIYSPQCDTSPGGWHDNAYLLHTTCFYGFYQEDMTIALKPPDYAR